MTEQDRIAELEARIDELEWRLEEITGAALVSPIKMSDRLFQMANMLARRAPMAVKSEALSHVASTDPLAAKDPINIMKVQLSKLRKHLKAHGVEIETVHCVGYRMSRADADLWKQMVSDRNEGIAA